MLQNLLESDGNKGFVAVLVSTSPIVAEQIRRNLNFFSQEKSLESSKVGWLTYAKNCQKFYA